MLTYEDCIGLCGLTDEEVEALSVHEHIPEIIAAELGSYLIERADGERFIAAAIVDDLEAARQAGDREAIDRYEGVLKHFLATHPKVSTHRR